MQKKTRTVSPLELSITARTGVSYVALLNQQVPRAAALAKSALAELSIVLVGDAMMCRLHQRFFNDAARTDVITFPLDTDARGRAVSGELYLCVPQARRQAKLRGIPVEHELLLYAVHGILHLNGQDDLTAPGYQKMHKLEDQILGSLGIGVVFAAGLGGRLGGGAG